MLFFLSHLCGVRLMFSYSFFLSFFIVSLFFCLYLLLSFFFLICCLFFLSFFILLFIFLVIQSDLEQTYKKFDDNFHCAHVLIVKDYGKLGILCAENFGGFILRKKKDPPSQKGNAGLLFVMHMMC